MTDSPHLSDPMALYGMTAEQIEDAVELWRKCRIEGTAFIGAYEHGRKIGALAMRERAARRMMEMMAETSGACATILEAAAAAIRNIEVE